jgi:solute carrier family 35 (UDP-galactose transporter), member B1
MARTKQSTPLRREPSSEYVHGETRGTPLKSSRGVEREMSNGMLEAKQVNGDILKPAVSAQKDAGLLQLIFAAGGIYGSL